MKISYNLRGRIGDSYYIENISEVKPEQFRCPIIVQKPNEDGGGMHCPMCLSKASSLNNTLKGEACYQCREKHKIKIIPFPKSLSKVKSEKKKFSLDNYDT
jgi:hypothetical protein